MHFMILDFQHKISFGEIDFVIQNYNWFFTLRHRTLIHSPLNLQEHIFPNPNKSSTENIFLNKQYLDITAMKPGVMQNMTEMNNGVQTELSDHNFVKLCRGD